MAEAVASAIQSRQRLAIEAETGTGKSMAYLVPLLLRESVEGRPAVIATKTLQLQHQLMTKEFPLLQERLASPRKVVQARGWSNYLCLRKVEEPSEDLTRELGPDLSRLKSLADRHQGNIHRQSVDISPKIWNRVQADPLDCEKQQCPYFSRCGLFAERKELESADIILTNHAFLLSDLRLRREGGSLLPASDVLVLDEAHRLDEAATDHLTVKVDRDRFMSVLNAPLQGRLDALRFLLLSHLPESEMMDFIARFDRSVTMELATLATLASELLQEIGFMRESLAAQQFCSLDVLLTGVGERSANVASELAFALEQMVSEISDLCRDYESITPMNAPPDLDRLSRNLRSLASELEFLLKAEHPDWVFLCDLEAPALLARPVDNSQALNAELFDHFPTTIVTSASLRVHNSFDFFLARTGFGSERTQELVLPSPFDHSQSVFVGLARGGVEPSDPTFPSSLREPLESLVVGLEGRTFLLTTSHRRVKEYAQLLRDPLAYHGIELLVQGSAPPAQLLKRFASPGQHLLIGVDTFWEGVDIPGERLSCVVLTRLPFPVPSDPLFAARCRRIEELGGRPFDELSLPLTALKLKQGFGRLLRHSEDKGIFLILDPRICDKWYGKKLQRQLPCELAVKESAAALVESALAWAERHLFRNV